MVSTFEVAPTALIGDLGDGLDDSDPGIGEDVV
jgi:hypothetical protein